MNEEKIIKIKIKRGRIKWEAQMHNYYLCIKIKQNEKNTIVKQIMTKNFAASKRNMRLRFKKPSMCWEDKVEINTI